ncbi:F-box domain protein [Talaromyces stipitatus ATCC 10500]|uniref:F-box domain protein n=1 Tax=Talaromyces stipitatus (strain ATCC 10500 / CBS 375.48 / QM 6759 / NRRL 1006) TaxID=441959 RepID=B8MGL1_TALSN|nr:F-box domain protein [Talaromyces stipitatus ATCC 10500]EED16762.1 F-box domain protein [Talaromyces stipitatus ATCC 10500]
MLADLPSEIIYHIATFLPTASSLTRLSQTCQRLYKIITADDRIYRLFIRNRFPVLGDTPPFWKDVVQAVTSRSRALDRCAVVARFVVPSNTAKVVGIRDTQRHDRPTIGYRPTVDSYEVWTGERWQDREDVLAWGAAAEIALRIKKTGTGAHETWLRFNDLEHVSSHDDVRGLHLLRPDHQSISAGKQHLIYARARGDVSHIAIDPDTATYHQQQSFATNDTEIHSLDLSTGSDPILAVHSFDGNISLYKTTTKDPQVTPFAQLEGETEEGTPRHFVKFLAPSRLAVGHGKIADTIVVSDLAEDRISTHRELTFEDAYHRSLWPGRKARVGAIAPLGVESYGGGTHGEVFLAGWGNSRVRLHDLRSPKMFEREYIDIMDSNPIYCIQPLYDRFLVGSGSEAVVNIFDLRMHNYSHYETKPSPSTSCSYDAPPNEFSFFLSHHPPNVPRNRNYGTYRGPIYTMSSPSPTSSTVYTGVVDGVVRLDFGSTDDFLGDNTRNWYQDYLDFDAHDLSKNASTSNSARHRRQHSTTGEGILALSGYERPSPENKSASAKLRSQVPFWSLSEVDEIRERESGWDRRWRRLDENQSWRSRGG